MIKNPRAAAFLALRQETLYLREFLDQWRRDFSPSEKNFSLASELALGTMRRKRTLQHIAEQIHSPLKLKKKERWILYLALYQHYYMDRIPIHAIANESVNLAKKYTHTSFAKFLNMFLKKMPTEKPPLSSNLGIQYSFPDWFVEEVQEESILKALNAKVPFMARSRKDHSIITFEKKDLKKYSASPDYYIQNSTTASLMHEICEQINPKSILDLCAAPGGKSIALHDHFPKASLTANDPSERRLKILQENFKKYGIQATLTSHPGETYPTSEKYDLIVIDAPCSNSGVLSKKPEARWRLNEENIATLQALQKKLLKHALTLLNPGGHIAYLTCSILKKENEAVVGHNPLYTKTILPSSDGAEGGFGALLK